MLVESTYKVWETGEHQQEEESEIALDFVKHMIYTQVLYFPIRVENTSIFVLKILILLASI